MRHEIWLLVAALTACNRTEQPATQGSATPTSPSVTQRTQSNAPAPSVTARAACVVPMPAEPPERARKAAHCPKDPGPVPELPKGYVRFPEAPGAPRLDVEFALVPEHQERGLMYRTALPDEQGMLFTWGDERVRTFWMHNTCIPLDMLFVAADGTIAGIQEQVPTLNDSPRSVPCPAAHVLEVNAGWTRSHGVKPGMKLVIER